MAFTVETMDSPIPSSQGAKELDLPSKEFIGYDPKGTTSVTGSSLPQKEDVRQPLITETASETTEEAVTLSPKISAIARKEAAQRQREVALRRREEQFAEKIKKAERFDQLQAKFQAKDYSAAEEMGMTHEEYTNYLIEKQNSSDPKEERYLRVEKQLQDLKKQQEELEVREYQANQSLWKSEISKVISEKEEFSSIKELKAEDAVLRLINDSFDEDGTEYTVEQAAKLVEQALLERAELFSSISKIRSKSSEAPKVLGPPKIPKTITQDMTVTSHKTVKKPFHLMSESEQIAEAYRRVQEQRQMR
jgi:hypothetical protein